ncbi:MAG TPA: alpha/beta hydrolase [Nitrososphaeraceae archaeon]|jgi:pimeloyl-ACP methyl ester carboxylesterase|nr:alpha/beta hydrolase [Nitrososphaeraceae archaeon]
MSAVAAPIQKKVATEAATIYCEYRGRGPLLLLIPGAMEDAGFYSTAADILAEKFTVVCYDRRCNSRSSGNRSVDMTVAQQARDAAAIIKAMGTDQAVILGRSGGAIIGLELAATKPKLIDFLIVHEAPVIELLPDADAQRWRAFFDQIYTKSQREGRQAAQTAFMASLINVPDTPYPPDLNERISGNVDFFFKHEFRAFFAYIPHIESMRNNKVKMVTAIGKESDNAYYVQATRVLAAKLGCATIEFPGHHDVSFWMPEEFASAILGTLERFYMS